MVNVFVSSIRLLLEIYAAVRLYEPVFIFSGSVYSTLTVPFTNLAYMTLPFASFTVLPFILNTILPLFIVLSVIKIILIFF